MSAAVHSPLGPRAYYQPEWLEQEQRAVFGESWLFAGFSAQLAHVGDYVTLDACGWPVLVYRGEEGIRAFRNVCSHRFSEILSEESGRGVIRCRYHGWTYDESGHPTGIPGQRELFQLEDDQREELVLKQYQADLCGPLVFVRLSEQGSSLREYLDDFWPILEGLGHHFALPFMGSSQSWNANWKLGVENTLEPYHSEFVHQYSLAAVVETQGDFTVRDGHSHIKHRLLPGAQEWWAKQLQATQFQPCPGFDHYHHFFIYPNLCLGLTHGTLLSVQTFKPLGPESCRLNYRLLLPTAEGVSGKVHSARFALTGYLDEFNQGVLAEDRQPVEACQRGLRTASTNALLGSSERRVLGFHQRLARALSISESDVSN
jgi:phenylpropionate dioxygenase-like ring-hydroxylating dioxygenase large terminal subunit